MSQKSDESEFKKIKFFPKSIHKLNFLRYYRIVFYQKDANRKHYPWRRWFI